MLYKLIAQRRSPNEISTGVGHNKSASLLEKGATIKIVIILALGLLGHLTGALAQSRHSASSRFPTYEGLVMCGYQGWFRAEGDGSGEGWSHYSNRGFLAANDVHPDFWPDVSEYEKTYPSSLTNKDGSTAYVFSSWDESTTDLHFRWMQQYGI
ncbi:MAG TPA: hypothetical protein VHC44_14840, partial [Verrucomicrobiae bacterium]|nr:hypothetical protein [Verrucomicrobiae bacterium]